MYTNTLEILDYLLPITIEQDDLKTLAEKDFDNDHTCIICAGLGEYDKADVYGLDYEHIEDCDNCNGKGYIK